jgi:hypothetical protein
MNRRVWWVLRDYVVRTVGLWLLVVLAQIIQCVTFWPAGVPHIPFLGAVIAGFAYTALAEKPRSVLRILPLNDTDRALIWGWGSFGLPTIALVGGTALAAWLSGYKGWTEPSAASLGVYAAISVAVLALLSAFATVLSYPGKARPSWYVAFVWTALAVVGVIGLPIKVINTSIVALIVVGSICLSAGICLPVAGGMSASRASEPADEASTPRQKGSRFSFEPTGWTVMMFEVGRTTAVISVAALVAAAVIHRAIAPWAQSGLHGMVIWMVVSAIAVASGISMRRWVEAVSSLRVLPITGHRLVLALYLAMVLPGVLACLALSTAHHFSSSLGLDIPGYMLVVFLAAPVTLIRWQRSAEAHLSYLPQQWGPVMQQAVWPAWAGVFCVIGGLQFMPSWFVVYLATLAVLFCITSYRALLAGIRSPATLESHRDAMLESF